MVLVGALVHTQGDLPPSHQGGEGVDHPSTARIKIQESGTRSKTKKGLDMKFNLLEFLPRFGRALNATAELCPEGQAVLVWLVGHPHGRR